MPQFDSREYAFSDIKLSILAVQLKGFRGLTWKKSQEKEEVYGEGDEPKAIQRGNKKYEGSLMLLKSDFDLLNEAARAAGYDDIVDVPGDLIIITCAYLKPDAAKLSVDTLFGVDVTEMEDGMKQNDKFKEVTLPFKFLRKKQV